MSSNQTTAPAFFSELREGDLKSIIEGFGSYEFERILGKSRHDCTLLIKDTAHDKRLLLMRMQSKTLQTVSVDPDKTSPFPIIQSDCLHELQEIYFNKCSGLGFVIKPDVLKESESFIATIRPFSRFNLSDRIASCSLETESRMLVAHDLTEAIFKLHEAKCWHGDLSCRKVLLSSQAEVFLSDFNATKPFSVESTHQSAYEFFKNWYCSSTFSSGCEAGNGCYLAPERLQFGRTQSYQKADLFSLGCILGEIFGEGDAFLCFEDTFRLANCKNDDEYNRILDAALDAVEDDRIGCLIRKLCHRNPDERVLELTDAQKVFSVSSATFRKRELLSQFNLQRHLDTLIDLQQFQMNRHDLESLLQIALTEEDLLTRLHTFHLLTMKWPDLKSDIFSIFEESFGDFFVHLLLQHTDKLAASKGRLRIAHGLKCEAGKRKEEFMHSILKDNLIQEASELADDLNMTTPEIWSKFYQLYRSSGDENLAFEELFGFYACRITSEPVLWNTFTKYSKVPSKLSKNIFTSRIAFSLDLAKNDIPFHVFYSGKDEKDHTASGSAPAAQFRFRQRLMSTILFEQSEQIIDIFEDRLNNILIMYCPSNLYFWDLSALCLAPRTVKGPFATAKPRNNSSIKKAVLHENSLVILYSDGLLCRYGYTIQASMKQFELLSLNLIDTIMPIEEVTHLFLLSRQLVLLSKDMKSIYTVSFEEGSLKVVKRFDFEVADILNCNGLVLVCGANGSLELVDFMFGSAFTLKKWHVNSQVELELHSFNVLMRESVLCLSIDGQAKDVGIFTVIFNMNSQPECLFRFWYLRDGVDDKNLPILDLTENSDAKISLKSQGSSILTANEIVMVQGSILRLLDWNCFTEKNASSILSPPGYRPTLKLRNRFGQVPEILEKYPNSQEPTDGKNSISFVKQIISIDSVNRLFIAVMKDSISLYC